MVDPINTDNANSDTNPTEDDILSGLDLDNEQVTPNAAESTDSQPAQTPVQDEPQPNSEDVSASNIGEPQTPSTSGPQDLIGADGKVIAKGGAERRVYEKDQRIAQSNTTLTAENENLRQRITGMEQANTIGTQLGLTTEETIDGAKLMQAWKSNPVETVKYLLTQAQAMGHNIEGIGVGTDVKAFEQMLNSALKPFTDERATTQATEQQKRENANLIQTFSDNYPDGVIHHGAIAQLIKDNPSLSLEAAYFKLQNFYLTKQLDWTKSLNQIAEEQKANPQPGTVTTPNASTIPQGNNLTSNVQDVNDTVSADSSMDEIIRESIKEAGIR